MGGALGIAILGSIGTAIYRLKLASDLPASIPDPVVDAAEDTLGAALLEAMNLKDGGEALMIIAKESFTDALQFILLISAFLSAILAVFIYIRLVRAKSS